MGMAKRSASDDPRALVRAVKELKSMTAEKHRQMEAKGHAYVTEKYDYRGIAGSFINNALT